jgi:two-component system sensor histidine kinase DesK
MSRAAIAVRLHELPPRWVFIAMHAPFVAFPILQVITGIPGIPDAPGLIALPVVLAAAAIQVRHSLAAARGIRPRYWLWSLVLLVVVTYAPLPLVGRSWMTLQWFAIASLAMLLPVRIALPLSLVLTLATGAWQTSTLANVGQQHLWSVAYMIMVFCIGGWALYGSAVLVRLIDELNEARALLGDVAIARERLRISRDLHDVLGQSLSAVSLKGQLAIGLLRRNKSRAAAAEIEDAVAVTRSVLHDLRDIPHGALPMSLRTEIERAADLLAAAGIEARFDTAIDALPARSEELLAWAVREGVTNVLRHSSANWCSIDIQRDDDVIRMEMRNDGPQRDEDEVVGHGLSGLAARAAALSGSATGSVEGSSFHLDVQLPVAAT